jgi:hypothetical protein
VPTKCPQSAHSVLFDKNKTAAKEEAAKEEIDSSKTDVSSTIASNIKM